MVKNYSSISLGYLIKTVVLINLEFLILFPKIFTTRPGVDKVKGWFRFNIGMVDLPNSITN